MSLQDVHDLDLAMVKIAMGMSERGMPMDVEYRDELREQLVGQRRGALFFMREFCGKPEFAATPAQLRWAMFDPTGPCRLTATTYTAKTRVASTAKVEWMRHIQNPFVRKYSIFRAAEYKINSVIDAVLPGEDARIYADWDAIGARTGRWTSSPNFQNWQKAMRRLIRARKGRRLWGADFAQLELRIIAAFSGDKDMIRLCIYADEARKLEPDHDPHSYAAARTFGTGFTDLLIDDPTHDKAAAKSGACPCQTCKRKHLRESQKNVTYGMQYGGGGVVIYDAMLKKGIENPPPVSVIDAGIKGFFRAFPDVKRWREDQYVKAKRDREVRDAVIGRRRPFPLGDPDYTISLNFPVQATAASIMSLGLRDLMEKLHDIDPTAEPFAQVHDAIYGDCAEDKADEVQKLVTSMLSCEMQLAPGGTWMPFPAECQIADTWDEA